METQMIAGIINQFAIYGEFVGVFSFGAGPIKNTFQFCWDQTGTMVHYLEGYLYFGYIRGDKENLVFRLI